MLTRHRRFTLAPYGTFAGLPHVSHTNVIVADILPISRTAGPGSNVPPQGHTVTSTIPAENVRESPRKPRSSTASSMGSFTGGGC